MGILAVAEKMNVVEVWVLVKKRKVVKVVVVMEKVRLILEKMRVMRFFVAVEKLVVLMEWKIFSS